MEERSYAENLAELESILASMRGDNCDIDTLAARTARAGVLIELCRRKLVASEEELNQILNSLAKPQE